mmetsp:Transcript_80065/g.138969  ORF Transcript_80065/g.138969 Transcript_80065/m.138969 type:complete len:284 (-) Transcript_80065:166-1017(-)
MIIHVVVAVLAGIHCSLAAKNSISMYMERDGHFQLESSTDRALVNLQSDLAQKVNQLRPDADNQLRPDADTSHDRSEGTAKPKCHRCPSLSEHAIGALESLSKAESADHAAQHLTRLAQVTGAPSTNISSALLENRSVDWRVLSMLAANSLAQSDAWLGREERQTTTVPTVPPQRFQSKPKGWTERGWNRYQEANEKLAPLRGGVGNVGATMLAALLGPDSCILKILYVFYIHDGEDDYPYVPRHCGDFFDFAMFSYTIKVPWMLIAGTTLAVISWSSSWSSS